jgi:hypothetical protein
MGIYAKEMKTGTQTLTYKCLQQHYTQQTKGENKPNAY